MGIVALIVGLIACAALVGQACALAELRRQVEELTRDLGQAIAYSNGLFVWTDRRITILERRADLMAEAMQQRPAHAVAWQELFGRN